MRYPLLDILRYVAAMMVTLMHFGLEIGQNGFYTLYSIPVLGYLVKSGKLGVEVFFMISGFVIIETAQRKDFPDFVIARIVRLLPGLVVSMLMVLIVGSISIAPYKTPLASFINSIFLTYPLTGVQPLAPQLWTLIYEMKFYAVIAVFLLLTPKSTERQSQILTLLACWQLLIFFIRLIHGFVPSVAESIFSLDQYGTLFALGICLNLISHISEKTRSEAIKLLIATSYFFWLTLHQSYYDWVYVVAFITLIYLSSKVRFGGAAQQFSNWLGLSSYIIYLIHLHVGLAFWYIFQKHVVSNFIIQIIATSIFITVLAVFLALFVEKPLQTLLKNGLLWLSERIRLHPLPLTAGLAAIFNRITRH